MFSQAKGANMISGVSSTTTSQSYSASSSTSKSDEATLKSQLVAKQSELSQAKADEEKASLESEISDLKSRISEAASSAKQSQQSGASSTKAASGKQGAPWAQAFQTADKAAAGSKFSSAAMDVLMRMPKGGMESADEVYAKLDTNDDNSLSKEEFVAGRDERMSEEDAAKLFTAMDTESKGSITKDQFGAGMMPGGMAGGPPMGSPPDELQKPTA
jgi:Ca2+-binding EF-hand superfamily protein